MVVCKFFQQGNCRYGQNCRFDHIYGSKYSYHAPGAQSANNAPAGVTDDQLVNQVLLDVQAALKGGQWILSCYSPYKEKPNFPGITDLSMEEARLFIYEAKANNNLDQAVTYMNNLYKEYTNKYEQLLQTSPAIIKVLKSLYKGEIAPSPFTNNNSQSSGFGSSSAASSIFRGAVQGTSVFRQSPTNATPSIFSQNSTSTSPSIFGQSAAPNTSVFNQSPGFAQSKSPTPGVFGQASPENAKSIFAQASQNVFGPSQSTNVFGSTSPESSAKSIFAQASQNAFSTGQPANPASVFGEATKSAFGNPSSPFSPQKGSFSQQKDPFSQQKDPFNQQKDPFNQQKDLFNQQKDPFSKPIDPFNQNNPFASSTAHNAHQVSSAQANDSNIYSDINNLTSEQVEAYKADDFKLCFIPEVPPPYALCF